MSLSWCLLAPVDFGGFLPFWRGGFWSQRQVVTYRSNRFFEESL